MRICLFEDRHVDHLEPLTLTRPAHDLLCGQTTLADKLIRAFSAQEVGALVRPRLLDLQRQLHPGFTINDTAWLRSGATLLVNSRWLPPARMDFVITEPCMGLINGEVAFAFVPASLLGECTAETVEENLEQWQQQLPVQEAGGTLIRHLWELVELNGQQIVHDWESIGAPWNADLPPGLALVGPRQRLCLDPTAHVDPMVVIDTTSGPVIIAEQAMVTAFTRLEGPCFIGPHTQILGAKIRAGTSFGPHCRIGGEVEATVVQGYSNKYHDGFLGHAYLGEWINLGAGTSNSDLRNDYGEVLMTVAGRRVGTGRNKVGCFLGDHTKTGLGTLLNTGTNAGVFCNLLPCGGLLPKYVPSFCSIWNGVLAENTSTSELLETARKVMKRRGFELTDAHVDLYCSLITSTAVERQRALREAEQRRLRISA